MSTRNSSPGILLPHPRNIPGSRAACSRIPSTEPCCNWGSPLRAFQEWNLLSSTGRRRPLGGGCRPPCSFPVELSAGKHPSRRPLCSLLVEWNQDSVVQRSVLLESKVLLGTNLHHLGHPLQRALIHHLIPGTNHQADLDHCYPVLVLVLKANLHLVQH